MINSFLFQSKPVRYDLRQKLVPSTSDTWYATRYRNEMHPGDFVFFWMAGDPEIRGVYGWGNVESSPYFKPNWDNHGIDVKYEQKFKRAILARSVKEDPVLSKMLIVRAPQATNFLLSQNEAKRLVRLVEDCGEVPPWIPGVKIGP